MNLAGPRDARPPLDDAAVERFSRQIILRELGGAGQRRFLASWCRISGEGAAAEVCAAYLAAAGVGRVDRVPPQAPGRDAALLPLARDPGTPAARRGQDPDRLAQAGAASATGAGLDQGGPAIPDVEIQILAADGERTAPSIAQPPHLGRLVLRRTAGVLEILASPAASSPAGPAGAPDAKPPTRDRPDAAGAMALADETLAGTWLALASCRWLMGIGRDEPERRWRLEAGGAGWREI